MTQPPTGGTLGGGFQSGDDFVAARVTIDVPTEGIAGLREITQEMDRFRTSVESANRASETFTGYLQRIAEAANQAATAQQNLVTMLERSIEYQNRSAVAGAGGGPQPQLNAPAQYTDPFAAQTIGMGTGGPMAGGGGMVPGGGGDINTQLDSLRTQNPRAYINKMAASGQYRMGDIPASSPSGVDIQSAADRIGQRAQLTTEGEAGLGTGGEIGSRAGRMGAIAQQVLNEVNPGANGLGVPGLIQRSLGAMGGLGGAGAGLGMGRLAGMAGMIGPAAGAIGLGMAGYGLVQGAGGIYQDYKNMGLVRGGGAAEGVGYEMNIRAMAMNPFISSDQARQIVQQGLRDGYTGKEFDTITGMVAQNLKDFNIEVGESFKMLRKNVMEGGQSGPGFMSNMESLKQLSAQGYRSLPELQQAYASTSATLIDAGMPGQAAGQAAMMSGQMFGNNMTLKEVGDQITQNFATNPTAMAMMKYQGGVNVPAGLPPQAMMYAMTPDALEGGSMQVVRQAAMQAHASAGRPRKDSAPYLQAVMSFDFRLKAMGLNLSPNKVKELFDTLVEGGDPFKESKEKVEATQREQTQVRERSGISQYLGSQISGMANVGGALLDLGGAIAGSVKDYATGNDANIEKRWGDFWEKTGDRAPNIRAASSAQRIPMLDILRNSLGPGGFEVVNKDRQVIKLDQDNREQMDQLSSGQLKVRPKGSTSGGYTLQELPTASGADLKQFMGAAKTEVSGAVQITLAPDAQRLLQIPNGGRVPLTPHEEKANFGYGQATPNNAPPGEGRR